MSDEQNQEITSPTAPNNAELAALKSSVEALEKKNFELIGKLKQAKTVPDGVDIQELLDFKAKAEQADLEKQGKYTEARQALEQQFREASEAKDQRIAELEARVRELELIAPLSSTAMSASRLVNGPRRCRLICRKRRSLLAVVRHLAAAVAVIFRLARRTRFSRKHST